MHILLAALVGIAPIYIAIQQSLTVRAKMLPMAPSMAKKGTFLSRYPVAADWCCGAGDGFAEGSANDWLPLLMVDGHGLAPLPAR